MPYDCEADARIFPDSISRAMVFVLCVPLSMPSAIMNEDQVRRSALSVGQRIERMGSNARNIARCRYSFLFVPFVGFLFVPFVVFVDQILRCRRCVVGGVFRGLVGWAGYHR